MQLGGVATQRWSLEQPGVPGEARNSKGRERSNRMRTRGRWKDIPGRRNDLSKGKEVGTHEDHLKAGDRLVGSEPTSKERSLVKETDQVRVSERPPVGSAGKLDGPGELEVGRPRCESPGQT